MPNLGMVEHLEEHLPQKIWPHARQWCCDTGGSGPAGPSRPPHLPSTARPEGRRWAQEATEAPSELSNTASTWGKGRQISKKTSPKTCLNNKLSWGGGSGSTRGEEGGRLAEAAGLPAPGLLAEAAQTQAPGHRHWVSPRAAALPGLRLRAVTTGAPRSPHQQVPTKGKGRGAGTGASCSWWQPHVEPGRALTLRVMTPNCTRHRWHSSASTQSGAWGWQSWVTRPLGPCPQWGEGPRMHGELGLSHRGRDSRKDHPPQPTSFFFFGCMVSSFCAICFQSAGHSSRSAES